MGKFSGCLLASDYDGTLADSHGRIPDEVREAIKYFTGEGGLFTVCTGRTKQGFHAYDPELINAPVLLANAAMGYDYKSGITKYVTGVEKEDIPVVEYIRDNYPGLGIEIYSYDFRSCVINPVRRNIEHFEWQSIDYEIVKDVPQDMFPAVKIMIHVGEERCMDFQNFLSGINLGGIKFIPQYGEFLELISLKTDKGKGLLKLADIYGIDHGRVFAVGDGANDVTMLSAAAVGFVPENGDEYAKAAGDVIVSSNDDFAVADAIARIEKLI